MPGQLHAKSIKEAARVLGRCHRTLTTWARNDNCPLGAKHKTSRGYNLESVRRWGARHGYEIDVDGRIIGNMAGRNRKPAPVNGHDDGPRNGNRPEQPHPDYTDPDQPSITLKLRQAQTLEKEGKAALVQLQLQERTGQLVAVEEVKEHARKTHDYLKGTLEMWSRSLGPSLAGKTALEITTIMVGKVREIMRTFSGEEE